MNKQVENVMGTQRMSRLVLSTGVPLMMSLLISSLYNFVDSVFVSRVSEDALAAVSLAASITNLILDPIFIFGLFGLPRMETLGAAIATVIGQIVGMIAGVIINRRWNREIPFGFPFHPDFDSVLAILKVGLPSTFVQMMTAGVNVVINSLLITFSSTAIAVYGVCTRIFNVVSVGVHGINNGLIPIVAYNFGAKKIDRIREAVKWAVIDSVAIYFLFLSVLQISPNIIMRLFDASDYMMMIGIPALRILSIAWLLTIPNLVCGAALQGLSFGMKSMYLNLIRQAILPVSFALIFSSVGILNLVWLGFVLSEILCFPIALMLWKKAFHNLSPCSF